MSLYQAKHPSPVRWQSMIRLAGLAVLISLIGCQKDESPDSSVVEPPDPGIGRPDVGVPAASGSGSSDEAPGLLELPADADLTRQPDTSADEDPGEDSSSSGGLEMPDGVSPEDTSGASANPIGGGNVRYATWQQIENDATTTGKVTVVDLWSLVCEPCLKEFPGLVRLHQQYGDRVQCIAVDVDFDGRKTRPPETYEQRVTTFIESVGATFPTYISRTPSDDVYAANNVASIPAVLVFDASGNLVKVFEDAGDTAGFTYEEDIAPLVGKLAG